MSEESKVKLTKRAYARLFDALLKDGDGIAAALAAAQLPLSAAGDLGNAVGDGLDALIPDTGLMEKVMGTETAQKLLRGASGLAEKTGVPKYLRENESVADALGAAGGMMNLAVPAGTGSAVRSIGHNIPTKIHGFYGKEGPKALLKYLPDAMKNAAKEQLDPQARANARVKGTGQGRVDELSSLDMSNRTDRIVGQGNLNASRFIAQQEGKRDTLSHNMPTPMSEIIAEGKADSPEVLQGLMSRGADRATAENLRDRAIRAQTAKPGKAEAAMQLLINPKQLIKRDKNPHTIVRDPAAPESQIGQEGAFLGKQSPRAGFWIDKQPQQMYAKSIGKSIDDMDAADWQDYLEVANSFARDKWLKSGLGETTDQATVAKQYLAGKMNAKAGKKVTEQQQRAMEYVNANRGANTVQMGDGKVGFRGNSTSTLQDLGGVGNGMTVDTKNKTITGMLDDGHDLVGANPSGGESLVNLSPAMQRGYGSNKADIDLGSKTQAVTDRENAAVDVIAKRTGIPREKGESLMKYQQRVLRDYNAPVEVKDRIATFLKKAALANTAAATVGADVGSATER